MKEFRSINFVLGAKKIISVNALYGAKLGYAGGRPIATMYKKAEAKCMEKYIEEQVKLLDIPKNYPWVTKDTKFKLNFTVIFKSGFYLRDIDNCAKNLIDGIFRALEINDSHIISLTAHKKLMPGISEEKILVSLEEADDSCIRYDVIKKPQIVWAEDEIPEFKPLPKRGLKSDTIYYTAEKEKADTLVYSMSESKFTPIYTTKISMEAYEIMTLGSGFMYIAVDSWCKSKPEFLEWKKILEDMNLKCGRIRIVDEEKLIEEIRK